MKDQTREALERQRAAHALVIARAVTSGGQPDVFVLVGFASVDAMLEQARVPA